jgi:hypothetical protein
MAEHQQSPGRKQNAAQPLGEREGLVSKEATQRTAEAELKSAGPDGPDAAAVAAPFKRPGPTKSPGR